MVLMVYHEIEYFLVAYIRKFTSKPSRLQAYRPKYFEILPNFSMRI